MTGIRFAASVYPGGRMVLMCGSAKVGAVFPHVGTPPGDWTWRVWLHENPTASREGRARSELAAKNAALEAFRTFLTAAGLREVEQ